MSDSGRSYHTRVIYVTFDEFSEKNYKCGWIPIDNWILLFYLITTDLSRPDRIPFGGESQGWGDRVREETTNVVQEF